MQSNPNYPNDPNQYNQPGQPQQPFQQPTQYNQPGQPPQPYPYNPQQQPYQQRPDGPQQPYGQPPYGQPPFAPMTPEPKKKSKVGMVVGIVVGVLVLCVVIGVIAAMVNATKTPTATTTDLPATTTSSAKTDPTTKSTDKPATTASGNSKVGDEVKVNDKWTAKVVDVKTSTGSEIIKPKSGNVYVIVHVSLKNTSAETQNMSSILFFKLHDKDGLNYTETIYPDAGTTPDGQVAANSPLAGFLVYEVPASKHDFTLQFTPDITGTDQANWDLTV
ncbi:hypothetical protein KDA_10910 [Dictyobacter alpinus]|uniref:DUF4352 domain-containing protein n=1 Tax=Dictyobacter alpinus TaxID=2014873 RepID=A0A402B2R7_9CHLR|nr:DUF4352 domain-containing protein [Dictyobacter alpinus]GCE25607.1 hypothetical protein KDA_10910 [Dictyobacter alpinus]